MISEAIAAEDWWIMAVTATAKGEGEPPAIEIAKAWRKFGDTSASSLLAFRKDVRDCKKVLDLYALRQCDPVGQFESKYGSAEEISKSFYAAHDDMMEYRKRSCYLASLKKQAKDVTAAAEAALRNPRIFPDGGNAAAATPPEAAAAAPPGRVGSISG